MVRDGGGRLAWVCSVLEGLGYGVYEGSRVPWLRRSGSAIAFSTAFLLGWIPTVSLPLGSLPTPRACPSWGGSAASLHRV